LTNIPEEMQTVEQLVQVVDYPYINESMTPVMITAKEVEAEWQAQIGDVSMEHQLGTEVSSMLDAFVAGVMFLTPAEYNILQYYIEGHEITAIPKLAYISINTVRKHNKNIYRKLAVGTKEELLLYVDLLRRSNRLGELERN
jgi:DNA-binding NarL/FixJ family response regulator